MTSHKITPFLWFDSRAKDALSFYASVIPNSSLDFEADDDGTSQTYSATLNGQRVMALNGGPHFKLNSAFSFMIECDGQEETDALWEKFTARGEALMCGWVVDEFGLSWQIVPKQLFEFLSDPDPERSQRAMQAMLQMKKIVISELAAAAANSN
jgi:predicted 3-demethylubiquinone-9 3-methyltransferase (glyoxalase superfamily)